MRRHSIVAMLAAALFPATALAQEDFGEDEDVFDGDYVIVVAGAGAVPTYEGSDNLRIMPMAGASGEISGIGFTIRGPSLSLDVLPDKAIRPGSKVSLRFGPQIRYRANRKSNIGDDVVAKLGPLKSTVEAGFRAGFGVKDLFSNEDRLSVGVSARWDISGNSNATVITPSANYMLPVSKGHVFGALISTQFVDGDYMDFNFGVTPEGSAASGLPVFDGKGGFKEASIGIGTARDFNNNFLDGGFGIGLGVIYTRLFGSAADSPITSIRGSRNQWFFAGGLGYIF